MARPSKNRPIIWHNGAIQTCIFLGERLMSSTIDPLAGKSALTPLGNEINGESLAQRIAELGEWFHNLDLHGVHTRSEEHTSELQSRQYLVCRLLLEKKNATAVAAQRIRSDDTDT